MKKNDKHSKESYGWRTIIFGIFALIIVLPIVLIMWIVERISRKKKSKDTLFYKEPERYGDDSPLVRYQEPNDPADDREFISRMSEFCCFQYKSYGGYKGGCVIYQIVADRSPEIKQYILDYLQEHPIEKLLYGNKNCPCTDMDEWEICFIFEDQNLNKCIRGYGTSEDSSPYVCGLCGELIRKEYISKDLRLR